MIGRRSLPFSLSKSERLRKDITPDLHPKEHGFAPGRGPTVPSKSHVFPLEEELHKGGNVQKASLLFEVWRLLADAHP
jgi:hypothetical protein